MNKKLLDKLIEQADSAYLTDMISGSRRGYGDDPANGPFNAKRVGKIIEGLTDEEREQLKDLTADDIQKKFVTYRRPRPERPVTRRRGPVTLSKKDD